MHYQLFHPPDFLRTPRRGGTREQARKSALKSSLGPPLTLASAAVPGVSLIVYCCGCGHQVELDPAEQAERKGLVCSACGGRDIDMVVSGTERR
jgi:hypothetical protein